MAGLKCMGCTACCEGDAPALLPREKRFEHVVENGHMRLARNEDGSCVYLAKGIGCKTHHDKPELCKQYDCRIFLNLSRSEYKKRMDSPKFQAVVKAAKKQPPMTGAA